MIFEFKTGYLSRMVLPVVTYIYMYKKYAFQEDAYRQLVGRIPWYSGREVSAWGEGVVFAWGGLSSQGVCLPGRSVCPEGCLPGGGIPACTEADSPPPPWTDRMTDKCKNITLPQLRCGW